MNRQEADGIVFWSSPVLERLKVKHGFFGRIGGVSQPPYSSLNTGLLHDDPDKVEQNRQRALSVIDLPSKYVYALQLGHSVNMELNPLPGIYNDLDVLAAQKPVPLGLGVADCVPIIVAQRNPDIVAVIHAGWRGLAAGVVEETVSYLSQHCGLLPATAAVAIGPSIGVDSYEVGPEVKQTFEQTQPNIASLIFKTRNNSLYLDVSQSARLQLEALGFEEIDQSNIDVYSQPDEFFSYRRDGETGRNAVFASL